MTASLLVRRSGRTGGIARLVETLPTAPRRPPDLIVARHLPRRWASTGALVGGVPRAVSAALLGTTALGAFVGAPMVADAADAVPLPSPESVVDTATFERALADLERRRADLTPDELASARRDLWSAYVHSHLGTSSESTTLRRSARTDAVMAALTARIESAMRVTAWDMAHPESWEPIEGHSMMKRIPESALKEMLVDAVRDVPLGDLPGGKALAALVRALPNAASLDAENMSFNELSTALGQAQKAWLMERFGPFLEEHRVALAVVGFGAVTAARASSPAAADLMDAYLPSIRIFRRTLGDGHVHTDVALVYRERRLLPDVDATVGARGRVGGVDLRATVTGTTTVERDPTVTARLGVGARVGDERRWLDLSGAVDTAGGRMVLLESGLLIPEDDLSVRGAVGARFGPGTARGDAEGRAAAEIGIDRRFRVGSGAVGTVGVWGGVEADTDGRHVDPRVGVVFTLRW